MKQYHNYSPEISTGDEPQEPMDTMAEEQPSSPEPAPAPQRRKGHRRQPQPAPKPSVNGKAGKDQPTAEPQKKRKSMETAFKEWRDSTVTRLVFGILLGGLGFWFAVAFISYFSNCIADQSMVADPITGPGTAVANSAGEGGARITELLINQGFGVGAVVIVVWLLCMSLKLLVGYPRFRILDFTVKSLLAFITLSVVVGMVCVGVDTTVNWGGFHGRYINEIIYSYIGWSGAIIISVVLISLFVVICLRDAIKWMLVKKRAYDERRRERREAEEAEMHKQEEREEMKRREIRDEALSGEGEDTETQPVAEPAAAENVEFDPDADTIFDIPDLEDEEDPDTRFDSFEEDTDSLAFTEEPDPDSGFRNQEPLEDARDFGEREATAESQDVGEQGREDVGQMMEAEKDAATDVEPQVVPVDVSSVAPVPAEPVQELPEPEPKPAAKPEPTVPERTQPQQEPPAKETKTADKELEEVMTVNVNQIEKATEKSAPTYDSALFTHEYSFPPTDYLRPGAERISVDAEELLENKNKIKQTLLDFGIPITSIEATVGPTVTLYEIRPDTGVKIAKIRGLVDDLALSLAANGVRIIAPIPGKGTVGIEVANKDAQTVSMRTIIQSKAYRNSKFKLPVALGSTISNEVYIADLAKMPHLLVAGATGQGKSVGLNAIVTSLLYSKRPEELKFVMVDPKRVEFSLYSKIEKYYLAKIPDSPQPIITNMENVVATLSSLCVEMDERYKLLESAFVRQVTEYNDKFKAKKLDPREGHRFMPYIVVIIDEFADLIMTAGKEVELPIARLAQLARAVGIHVIIATQRPSTNVITGMIKANFPVRIAFKVSSGVDSKTILDSTGAQQLIGRGDMLISNNGEMTRVQCAFVDTPEVEEVCDYIARQPYPQGPYILPEPQNTGDGEAQELDTASMGKLDPLLKDIARQVVASGVASTSAVQRRYEIGYNRAGRIMDQLEALGVVGPATGGKPRSVLIEPMALEDLLDTLG